MSATETTPTSDQVHTADRLCEHAHHARADADDHWAAGDFRMAAVRLLEASELLRLAAHQLDPGISAG